MKKKQEVLSEQLDNKGLLHSKVQERYNERQQKFEKLLNAVNSLAEPMQLEIPKLVEEKPIEEPIIAVFKDFKEMEYNGVWEDRETADFYENIPDLRSTIPLVLLRLDPSSNSPSSPSNRPSLGGNTFEKGEGEERKEERKEEGAKEERKEEERKEEERKEEEIDFSKIGLERVGGGGVGKGGEEEEGESVKDPQEKGEEEEEEEKGEVEYLQWTLWICR